VTTIDDNGVFPRTVAVFQFLPALFVPTPSSAGRSAARRPHPLAVTSTQTVNVRNRGNALRIGNDLINCRATTLFAPKDGKNVERVGYSY
jgi:hypothetical protein